jgi:uncharacterized protein YjbI with pentapeptide repeats
VSKLSQLQPLSLTLLALLSAVDLNIAHASEQKTGDLNATDFTATDFTATDFTATDFTATDFTATDFTATELNINGVSDYAASSASNSREQVTSITQFSDVYPTDWAYQALSNLIERYGCVAGRPQRHLPR